ncbi:hypothetical protein CEXT_481001 [Caerostris extrusa]|uniref:Uncharacterized protein n=1 Tax=Caerostris extrusa TaxID=172846 RepID=A0AAV4SM72_CAEEX|nr:hypothetical protein CEXT_481001 [Caerostris extrusa]
MKHDRNVGLKTIHLPMRFSFSSKSLSEQIRLLSGGCSSREVAAREGEVAAYLHGALSGFHQLKRELSGE